jgi:hypothetical protein
MIYFGYDPGGNNGHGAAALHVKSDGNASIDTALLESAEAVIDWFHRYSDNNPTAIGVDTLTCWSTGPSGWRPADRWLKERYPSVRLSVASPNSLYGSMSLNGMAVLLALKADFPQLLITETHPKVLHWHFRRSRYDWVSEQEPMNATLAEQLDCGLICKSDHEWDAAISALAAYRWASGQWQRDLHALPRTSGERLISPCGPTSYAWPE